MLQGMLYVGRNFPENQETWVSSPPKWSHWRVIRRKVDSPTKVGNQKMPSPLRTTQRGSQDQAWEPCELTETSRKRGRPWQWPLSEGVQGCPDRDAAVEPLLAGAPLVRGDWEVHLRVQGPPPTPAPITCDSWVQGYLLQQGERGKGPHQCSTCLPGEGPCGVQLRAGGLPQHAGLQTLDAG